MGGLVARIKKKYKKLYTTLKRYVLLTGGRGSGKTHAVLDYLVRLLEEPGNGVLYTRYTMTSVEKTIIPLFVGYINIISDSRSYHITKTKITHKTTGSFIMFSGIKTSSGDQTANLKTLPNINVWVVEEAEDYNRPQSFIDIDDSIREKDKINQIILIMNPTTRQHFFYKKFFEGNHKLEDIENGAHWVSDNGEPQHSQFQRSTHPEVEHIHTTYYDNVENLDKGKVEQWETVKEKDPVTWTNKYGGAWIDVPEGAVFKDVNWITEFPKHITKISYGMDFGFTNDPTTLIRVGTADGQLYAEMLLHETGLITSNVDGKTEKNINDRLINIGFNRKNRIICDTSHPVTRETLKRLRWSMKKCHKKKGEGEKGFIVSGIDKIKSYSALNIVYCKEWSEEQSSYIWIPSKKADKDTNEPIDDFNHLWDALRYGMQGLQSRRAKTRTS